MQFSQGSLFNLLLEINFLHYAILLFVISVMILVTVSKLTPPPNLNQIQGLCLQTSEKRKIVWSSMDVRLSMGLIGLVLILWFVFSKWGIAWFMKKHIRESVVWNLRVYDNKSSLTLFIITQWKSSVNYFHFAENNCRFFILDIIFAFLFWILD